MNMLKKGMLISILLLQGQGLNAAVAPSSVCKDIAHKIADSCKTVCEQQVIEYEKTKRTGIPPQEKQACYAGCEQAQKTLRAQLCTQRSELVESCRKKCAKVVDQEGRVACHQGCIFGMNEFFSTPAGKN